jgi:3-methyladenine DNA glycosylase AlkD
LDRAAVIALAIDLVDSGNSNARWVAYELVRDHAASMARITAAEVERLGKGLSSWDGVDTFSCFISGRAWRAGRISDACIHRWARSKDRWWRRAALVSTIPLNVRAQGGDGDVERTLLVCELLFDDCDEMVVKAMSWALRALSVRDAAAVAKFVQEYDQRLAPLVKREVRNKLETSLKNPKRARSASSSPPATSR